MTTNAQKISHFKIATQISLFVMSYLPLFIILIARIIYQNSDTLHWGGFNRIAIFLCFERFWVVILLLIIIIISIIGTKITFDRIDKYKENGFSTTVKNVSNKSSETINYLATYIIPFIYDTDTMFNVIITLFLICIMFFVYINSSLLVVNPFLAIKYGIFEIEFTEKEITRNVIVLTPNKFLLEGDKIKLYEIGHKLYYCF
jgi:hypothetical protein